MFKDDICFKPLQAADMLAWLVRDAFLNDGHVSGLRLKAFENIQKRNGALKHMTRDELMHLGARFLVSRSNVITRWGGMDLVSLRRSLKKSLRKLRGQD